MPQPILLVTSRNVLTVSGEWRLISERARALHDQYSISTLMLVYEPGGERPGACAPRVEGLELVGNYDTYRCLMEGIAGCIQKHEPCAVVVSGIRIYPLVAALARYRKPIWVDLHGTLDEWKEYRTRSLGSHVRAALLPAAKTVEKYALRRSEGSLVVSRWLDDYVQGYVGNRDHVTFVIPCGIRSMYPPSALAELREQWRSRWGLEPDEIAIVYSGGVSTWQLIRETIQLYRRIAERIRARLLVFTPETDRSVMLSCLHDAKLSAEDVILESHSPSVVYEALCGCDVGMLLRSDDNTNRAAFPNKFTDYVAAGLLVITSQGLVDPADIVREYQLGVVLDSPQATDAKCLDNLVELARNRSSDMDSFLARATRAFSERLCMDALVKPWAELLAGAHASWD